MTPSTTELREALEQILVQEHAVRFPIVSLERRPSPYRSSFPLEELHLTFGDRTALDLIFKNLHRQTLPESVHHAKPEFLHDPLREIETYRSLLAKHHLGTAHYYGASIDCETERYWLFLEKVPGDELYKIGDFSTWQGAARWLAGMHHQFAAQTSPTITTGGHWLKYDAEYFRRWMQRAQKILGESSLPRLVKARRSLSRLAANYDRLVERLLALPVTFIHGEFYASNVLISRTESALRVCPIDWEMAGVGPGLLDLAALVSGSWTENEKAALALAYHASMAELGLEALPEEDFFRAIDDCQLHLAVQWLGWSDNWSPPDEHAQDWLGEALRLAEKGGYL